MTSKVPFTVSFTGGAFVIAQPGKPAQEAQAVVCQILGKVPYSLTANQVKNPIVILGESLMAVSDKTGTTAVITMARFAPMAKPKAPAPAK